MTAMWISCDVKYYVELINWIFAPPRIGFPPPLKFKSGYVPVIMWPIRTINHSMHVNCQTKHGAQWLNCGGGADPRDLRSPTSDLRSPPLTTDTPPLILDPPHFTRRSLGYCACLNAPFDLFQLFNHRAPHTTKRRNYRCLHGTHPNKA